jgi:hypothetical protein
MNHSFSCAQHEQNEFSGLGISCPVERFVPLLSIPIKEYVANLMATVQRLELRPGDQILILRTANIHFVEALLSVLLKMVPDLSIDLVTQQAFFPYIRHSQVNAILIPDGPICTELLGDTLAQHSRKKYRLALVPYSNAHGNGYENVILAIRSKYSGKMLGIGSNGRLRIIYRYPRIAWAMQKPLRAAGFIFMLILLAGMALWFKGWLPAKRQLKKICRLR